MIVFDLDGTLALDAHRSHHLVREPKDWDSYFAACGDDEPNWPLLLLLDKLLWDGEEVEVWSGRSMSALVETGKWFQRVFDGKRTAWHASICQPTATGLHLEDNLAGFVLEVQMRHQTSRVADDEMKRGWLRAARESGRPVSLAFEDRQRVVDMWRGEGVVCCQVAKGDF